MICIVKKDQVDILFNHINQMDEHINFTMETPDSEGSIPFLNTKCSLNSNNIIYTTVYRKPTDTNRYLDWNLSQPTYAKRSVIWALTHRARMICSTQELLAKEMEYLHRILHRNDYPDWFLKIKQHYATSRSTHHGRNYQRSVNISPLNPRTYWGI